MIKVLLADDEPIMRKALTALIDWRGLSCEVVGAVGDGLAARQALEELRPQLLIADIKMPGLNGIEVAKYIYDNKLPVKVILLTAYADFSYAQQAIRYGVSEYVTKDGAMEKIVEAVERCKTRLTQESAQAAQGAAQTQLSLKSILDGSIYDEEAILRETARAGLSLACYRVLCMETRNLRGGNPGDPARQMEPFLPTAFPGRQALAIPMGKHLAAVILQGPDEDTPACCKKLAQVVADFSSDLLLIGISAPAREPHALRGLWQQATTALEGRFFREEERVFLWRAAGSPAAPLPDALFESLAAALARGAVPDAEKQTAEILDRLQTAVSPVEVRAAGHQLWKLCQTQLHRAGADKGELAPDEGVDAAIDACPGFSAFRALAASAVEEACRGIAETLQTSGDLVQSAQNYIARRYTHPITLTEISEAVGVNPSYLSRVFKARTGSSVVDAVTRLRMEQAQKLLAETSLKIGEVAQQVGLEDTNYFGQLFRRFTGQTPKQYRTAQAEGSHPHED